MVTFDCELLNFAIVIFMYDALQYENIIESSY